MGLTFNDFVSCTQFCSACAQNKFCCYHLNRNKIDVLKGDQSALDKKAWHFPLPSPPLANSQPPTASTQNLPLSRNNQLGPIEVKNTETNSSEKKKKKKKKKKKRTDDETADKKVEETVDNENEN